MPQMSIMSSAVPVPSPRARGKGRNSGSRESNAGNGKKMQPESLQALLVEGDSQFVRAVRASLSALTGARIELQAPTLPVVIVTSCDNDVLALDSVRQGAQDYVVKSKVDGKILLRVIRYAIERKRVDRRLAAQHAVTSVLAESATLSEATPKILQAICDSLEWDMGALWKVDAPAELLRCVAVWHTPAARIPDFEAITRGHTFAKGAGLPGRIWDSGKPAWVPNLIEDDNFPRAPVAAREGLHAGVGFPVKI